MELILRNNLKDKDLTGLPYFFSADFESFTQTVNKANYLLFYSKDTNALMPAYVTSIKSFRLLKILYPPVTLLSERLSADEEKLFLEDFINIVKKKSSVSALFNHIAMLYLMPCRIILNSALLAPTS